MSFIHVPVNYYRLKCHSCDYVVQTRDHQYHRCPRCKSESITSLTEQRYEQLQQKPGSSDERQAQADANRAAKRVLGL